MRKAPKGSDLHPIGARINRIIAMVRAKVEHPFGIIKRQFGLRLAAMAIDSFLQADVHPFAKSLFSRMNVCEPCATWKGFLGMLPLLAGIALKVFHIVALRPVDARCTPQALPQKISGLAVVREYLQ
ncbi:MAG: hypothetical protein MUF74_06420 [Cypionkella sp.]|jgi:hypothetical protein|nr:hypothetical protein [Cypionkella sp.]